VTLDNLNGVMAV